MKDFDSEKFEKNLKTGYIGHNIIYFKKIDSTNDYAIELIKEKAGMGKAIPLQKLDGSIVISETQEKGRGRFNKKWFSPPGGLWFSLIIKSRLLQRDISKITIITACSIAETLKSMFDLDIIIKWPNDIYYGGLKLGGILAETLTAEVFSGTHPEIYSFIVLGIGLNINLNQSELSFKESGAASLNTILRRELDRELILSGLLESIENNYNYFTGTGDLKTIFKKIGKNLTF